MTKINNVEKQEYIFSKYLFSTLLFAGLLLKCTHGAVCMYVQLYVAAV